jgi:hypothetical protein
VRVLCVLVSGVEHCIFTAEDISILIHLSYSTALHSTVLHCVELYSIALYSILQQLCSLKLGKDKFSYGTYVPLPLGPSPAQPPYTNHTHGQYLE